MYIYIYTHITYFSLHYKNFCKIIRTGDHGTPFYPYAYFIAARAQKVTHTGRAAKSDAVQWHLFFGLHRLCFR